MLHAYFRVEDPKSIEILKKIQRTFFIPEPVHLTSDDENGPSAIIEEIKLKDTYSSSYFHFKIKGL